MPDGALGLHALAVVGITLAVSAVLVGAPMYMGYFVAYRVARSIAGKGGQP